MLTCWFIKNVFETTYGEVFGIEPSPSVDWGGAVDTPTVTLPRCKTTPNKGPRYDS